MDIWYHYLGLYLIKNICKEYMQGIVRGYKDIITYFLPLVLSLLPLPSPRLALSSRFTFIFGLTHNFPSVFHAMLVFSFSLCSFSLGKFTYMPVTSPSMLLCTENHSNLHSQSSWCLPFSWGRQYSLVVKSTDSELGIPAPKLNHRGSLEKLLNFSMQQRPCGKVGGQ